MQGYTKLNGKLAVYEAKFAAQDGVEGINDFINDICMDPDVVIQNDGKQPRVLVSITKGVDYD